MSESLLPLKNTRTERPLGWMVLFGLLVWVGGVNSDAMAEAESGWIDRDRMVAETLIIGPAERERLIQMEAEKLSVIRPVALPTGRYLAGENRHLGWPVGIEIGGTLLCAYHQTLHHHGKGPQQDKLSSDAVVVRSTDGGETWSDPLDLREVGRSEKPMAINFGIVVGKSGGSVFLANKYGVYRTQDEGVTWELLPDAMTQGQTGFSRADNVGPRMIEHPEHGLVIPMGRGREPGIDLFSSRDQGATWRHHSMDLPRESHPLEPTFFYHDGRLIFLSRNHSLPFKWHQEMTESEPPVMMVAETGWWPMTHQGLTNIASHRWPDTTDVAFNPVTQRYEAVVTNRSGGVGVEARDEDNAQTVNLWSISPTDLAAGRADQWRFECTLLRLRSGMRDVGPNDVDAAHPGGAVMDVARGLQHIFIYAGRYATPTGIYRISRTLETDRLREFGTR